MDSRIWDTMVIFSHGGIIIIEHKTIFGKDWIEPLQMMGGEVASRVYVSVMVMD